MTKIYLIRHAEAEGNLYRRAQGQYNSNLTALGRRQVAALAERFRGIALDALWSSDLYRALSTASAVTKYHPQLQVISTPNLREQNLGVWEDVAWGDLARDDRQQMDWFSTDPARWLVPGGEPFAAVCARMRGALLALASEYPDGTVAAVSHGMAIRALLSSVLGVSSEEINRVPHGDNTAVSLLTAENGRLHVEWYNDSGHLTDGLSTFARQSWWRKEKGGSEDMDNVCFAPLSLPQDTVLYDHCYAATWLASHGNLNGYVPAVYEQTAARHTQADPSLLVKMSRAGDVTGILELDPDRGAADGAGWISLIYMEPDYRARRLGVQLLGHAVSVFRKKGRSHIRLHVSQTNRQAIGFYEYNGFRKLRGEEGVGGPLWLMDLDITPRIWALP